MYHNLVQTECDRVGAVAIAPTFDFYRFAGFGHFGGKWRPDLALIEVVQKCMPALSLAQKPFVLLGHSEGAQFVSRFALVYPKAIKRVAISGTDEVCWPDTKLMFPFGTGPDKGMAGGLPPLSADSWLDVPTLMVVGTKDVKADIAVSEKWVIAVNRYAQEKGRSERVFFVKNEGGVHSLRSNFPLIQNWLEQGFVR
jgi:pimeloyl-ACP methyl ester carboxylesterase